MEVVFVSNFFNHHQKLLSDSLYELTNGSYSFVSTEPMVDERKKLGYPEYDNLCYTINTFESSSALSKAMESIRRADVVIYGSAPRKLLVERFRSGELTFKYSERIFKIAPRRFELPARAAKCWYLDGRYRNVHLLCASAFASADYSRLGVFRNRAYKWGYFPAMKHYDVPALIRKKEKTRILWAGRMLDWKHPDDAVNLARRLRDNGFEFTLSMVGTGPMEGTLKRMIETNGLSNCVTLLGALPADKVREVMEQSGIYLFTSDRYEGWGAVLNESMNSACAVVASNAIGSVPYLVEHGTNGLAYHSGDTDELYDRVCHLLSNPKEQERLGAAAYQTIQDEWNGSVAADRLLHLSEKLMSSPVNPGLYVSGPCSEAETIADNWSFD